MQKLFQRILSALFIESILQSVPYFIPISAVFAFWRSFMLDQWLNTLLFLIGSTGFIWLIKSQLFILKELSNLQYKNETTKEILNSHNDIKDKLHFCNPLINGFITQKDNIFHCTVIYQIYNHSNRLIYIKMNEDITKLVVNEKTAQKPQFLPVSALPPYQLHNLPTYTIDIPFSNSTDCILDVNAVINLVYFVKDSEVQYEASQTLEQKYQITRNDQGQITLVTDMSLNTKHST